MGNPVNTVMFSPAVRVLPALYPGLAVPPRCATHLLQLQQGGHLPHQALQPTGIRRSLGLLQYMIDFMVYHAYSFKMSCLFGLQNANIYMI